MKSWKTSVAGIIGLIVLVLGVMQSVLTGGVGSVDWQVVIPAFMAALTGLLARDNDKSSEDVGAHNST